MQKEKLAFTTLKLLDLFLEKNIPEILDHLFLNSVQRSVSKALQSHHGNQQLFQVQSVSKLSEKFLKLFPVAEKFIQDMGMANVK